MGEPWPPVYDWEQLAEQIRDRAKADHPEKWFFEPRRPEHPEFCQGDVLHLDSALTYLDQDGSAVAEPQVLWLVLTNSCDLDRDREEVQWAQLVPLDPIQAEPEEVLSDQRAYRVNRSFFIPKWDSTADCEGYVADLLRPITADRGALREARILARLSAEGWAVLHSCLVRFLARSDGREARIADDD